MSVDELFDKYSQAIIDESNPTGQEKALSEVIILLLNELKDIVDKNKYHKKKDIKMVIEKSNPSFDSVQSLVYLFYNYTFEQMNIGYGSTIVEVLLIVFMILTVFQMYGQKKWVFYN